MYCDSCSFFLGTNSCEGNSFDGDRLALASRTDSAIRAVGIGHARPRKPTNIYIFFFFQLECTALARRSAVIDKN